MFIVRTQSSVTVLNGMEIVVSNRDHLFEICWILNKAEHVDGFTVHDHCGQVDPSYFGFGHVDKWL